MSSIYDIIVRPRLRTEKATFLKMQNQYVFEVQRTATKPQIKEAIEQLLNVKVKKVNTSIVPGKAKRRGRTPSYKKAIVTFAEGYTFNEYALEEFDSETDE